MKTPTRVKYRTENPSNMAETHDKRPSRWLEAMWANEDDRKRLFHGSPRGPSVLMPAPRI